jgi:hypothetical protein
VKQIVPPASGGPAMLLDVPRPVPEPTEVLVRTISPSPDIVMRVPALCRSGQRAGSLVRGHCGQEWRGHE